MTLRERMIRALGGGRDTTPARSAVPEALSDVAAIPGIPRARFWGDEAPPWTTEWFSMSQTELEARYPALLGQEHHNLAISGGGANGAFGTGLLCGWTETGSRPSFSMVTGISTGALIAPFAFLGTDHDDPLREIYTGVTTDDILIKRRPLKGLLSDAMADATPLQQMIREYITPDIMEAIAVESGKGRELLVGTTNLDAGRPVIWDIGQIAASGHPGALGLIHDVLRASASIPVAFPPVLVEVEAEGRRYDELHVDGGVTSQVFLYPMGIDYGRLVRILRVKGTPNVYLIRNARYKPDYEAVEPKLRKLAGRTIGSLLRTQRIGDMYRVYTGAKRDGFSYHLALIPDDFEEQSTEAFDTEYMGKLFDRGYQLAKDGYPWLTAPPG